MWHFVGYDFSEDTIIKRRDFLGALAEMMRKLAESGQEMADPELYHGGELFKQTIGIVAIQPGNLETGNIAPQDIAKQFPSLSILTLA